MRDHHFREDENELQYLVSQKRDDNTFINDYESDDEYDDFSSDTDFTQRKCLDDILDSMGLFLAQKYILKNELLSLLSSKDCTGLVVNEVGYDFYTFIITRENEYVKTTDEFEYSTEFELYRTFKNCYTNHNHDRLLANPRFRALVEKTEGQFIGCSGGYETDYSMADDKFTFRDEINVRVIFKVGSSNRSYGLDLDRMELSDDYHEF